MDDQRLKQMLANHQPQPIGCSKFYSVLLPLITVDGEEHVLYQVRSQHITQPGETSFPGGRIEFGETPMEAAVRETMEELNINQTQIDVLGEFDFIKNNHMMIYSYIGRLTNIRLEDIKPNEEVERLFTIPVKYLLDHKPKYYKINEKHTAAPDFPFDRIQGGKKYDFISTSRSVPFYNIPGENLWGFTAQITKNFSEFLTKNDSED